MSVFAPEPGLRKTFVDALPPAAYAAAVPDPALDCVASLAAEIYYVDRRNPVESLRHWLAWKCGYPATSFFITTSIQAKGINEDLDSKLADAARRLLPDARPRSYGIARHTRVKWKVQTVVVADRDVELLRADKTYRPGETLNLQVRRVSAIEEPVFYADEGGGRVQARPVRFDDSGAAWLSQKLPDAPGRYFVELRAREPREDAAEPDKRWKTTVLHFPVYVGVAEPAEPDLFITNPAPNPPDTTTWPQAIVAAYSIERARFGLPPLEIEPRLAELAQRRSDEEARRGERLPPDATLRARLKDAGLPDRDLWQSRTRGEFVDDYIAMQLLRPSIRARLFGRERLLFGVGVTALPSEERRHPARAIVEYWLTP